MNESAKAIIEEVNNYMVKTDLSVTKLRMVEASKSKDKDYTEYQFKNKKLNTTISVNRFSLK